MKLKLRALAPTTRGIYNTSNGPNSLPKRFLFLEPSAAASFVGLESVTGGLIYSDIARSAEESLHAMQTKRGVQPPAFSAHNFGFAVDVAVEETLKLRSWDYAELIAVMEAHGWYCHRRDGAAGYQKSESWHWNWLGDGAPRLLGMTVSGGWGAAVEQRIVDAYGSQFVLTGMEVQAALKKLHMYAGDVDGILGPLSRQGVFAFQRAWLLPDNGIADSRTQRVLAFVTADREMV